jgi:hypothetical protein
MSEPEPGVPAVVVYAGAATASGGVSGESEEDGDGLDQQ